jgi:hypothetical protein
MRHLSKGVNGLRVDWGGVDPWVQPAWRQKGTDPAPMSPG